MDFSTGRHGQPGLPTAWVIAAVAAAFLLYRLRLELLPFAFAAALAYVLGPLVTLLHRRLHLPRMVAVLVVYGALLGAVAAAILWGVAAVGEDAGALARVPGQLGAELGRLTGPTFRLAGQTVTPDEVVDRIWRGAQGWLVQPGPLLAVGSVAVAAPAGLVLMLVVLFYFLASGRRLAAGVLWLAPPAYRPVLRERWRRIDPMLRRYVRGILLVVLYTSVAAWLALTFAFHAALAGPTAALVGVLELVPVVGPAASLLLLGTIDLLGGGGLVHIAGLAALAIGLRVSIDVLVGPLVLGDAVTLHPVVVIASFVIAVSLFGVLGVLFAVPVAAAIKIVLQIAYGDVPNAVGGRPTA